MVSSTDTLSQSLKQAVLAYSAGDLERTEDLCRRIIEKRRDYFEALHLLAVAQAKQGKNNEALTHYDRALNVRPDYAQTLNNRAVALYELKRYSEALASYDQALIVQPDYAEAHCGRGKTLAKLTRFEEAIESYDNALRERPHYAEAHYGRGNILKSLKRFDEALISYEHAIASRSNFAEAYNNRGNTLKELNRLEHALGDYDCALSIRPDYYQALNNRGVVLHELMRLDDALTNYDRALEMHPGNAELHYNRGVTLKEMGRFGEAIACYERALTFQPDHAIAHWNESVLRLLTGDFKCGWEKHEWRWASEQAKAEKRNFEQPLWLGQDSIAGKTIFLHSEQGYGDTIQFCRYVPLVANRGARVLLEMPKPLHALMGELGGSSEIFVRGSKLPKFDFHCPLLSLPLAFGTRLETIPSATYLSGASLDKGHWGSVLASRRRPLVGLVWSGRANHRNDHNRSMSLRTLLPLTDLDATFVSVQKDVRPDDAAVLKEQKDLIHLGDQLKNFSDTAALILNLDVVISVDTSVAHLAGALGVPVWIMLPFIPDWRWLLDRDDSPWYPTARLFRQDQTRSWDNLIPRVRAALLNFLNDRT